MQIPFLSQSTYLKCTYIFISILCIGCAHTTSKPTSVRLQLLLHPSSLSNNISVQQHLKVERAGKMDELDTALEIDANQLNLVGLAFGQRVLSINYDGKAIKTWRHFMLPEQVRAEDILNDIQLTLWPVQVIREHLPPSWEIEENGNDRVLYKDKLIIAKIHYSDTERWNGTVILNNLHYQYRLTIQTAQ